MSRLRAAVVLAAALVAAAHAPAPAAAARPNVLVMVTDDQTAGTVTPAVMPHTFRRFVTEGRSYPRFTVTDPLCCPSRAAIMTGRFNHNNGVLSNVNGEAHNLDQATTLQCRLRAAGYRTGLFGKFLNGFAADYDPPCLDAWATTPGRGHGRVQVNVDGTVVLPEVYVDDLVIERALAFVDAAEARDRQPWYAYVAPTLPHSPYAARPEHAGDDLPLPPEARSPALAEADLTDKPPFVQAHADGGRPGHAVLTQLRMLRTVDEEVHALFRALRAAGELRRTLAVYVSDNGYLFGEHGLTGKRLPYTEAIATPFHVRWARRVEAGSTDRRRAQNIDIAPTVADATGVAHAPGAPFDGRSLLRRGWRRRFSFHEHFAVAGADPVKHWQPSWRSLRTRDAQYVEWRDGAGALLAREYYDLRADPFQLENLLGNRDPDDDPPTAALERQLRRMAACAGAGCR